ncbi:TolC family protein [Empedobacter falsenii]|uniref:Type I secretion outer membrane protein, TolC family n=1 Tax=Empedobacter falsenii TaxID=343874 RepID=A0A376GJS0_9FLAO|nr:TolC family protein [Empedobacter falsenii]STD58647.1 type I secretion outer membrane protein, TolC family [Empedobacter falsenii]
MNAKYFLLMVVLFSFLGKAQNLTLEDCLNLGRENQPDFKIQSIKIDQKVKTKRSFASQFLPTIDASVSHAYNFGSSIDPSTNTREPSNIQSDNLSINAQINLFDFSKLNQTTIQNYNIELEKLELKTIQNQYDLLVLEKYMAALGLQEWRIVLKSQMENSQIQFVRISKEVEEGKRPKSDFYDIQVIVLQDQNDLEKSKHDEIISKTELIQLLNIRSILPENMTLQQPLLDEINQNEFNFSTYPSIEKFELNTKKINEEYKQLFGKYVPSLFLNYSYGTFYAQKIKSLADTNFQFGNQLKDNKSQYIGLNLSIPIYSRGNTAQQRELKKIELQLNEAQKNKEEKRLNDLVNLELKKLNLLEDLTNSLIEIVKASEQSFETTEIKYKFDKVDASVYKSSKNQVLQSKYNELNNNLSQVFIQNQLKILVAN